MFITFIASSFAEIIGPSFQELKRKDITCSASSRNAVRSLSPFKKLKIIERNLLWSSPANIDIDFFPIKVAKELGQPSSKIFLSFFNINRFNSTSAEITVLVPSTFAVKIFPNLHDCMNLIRSLNSHRINYHAEK